MLRVLQTQRLVTRFGAVALGCAGLTAAACEKAPLLAPTSSTITVSAAARILPVNGTTEVTATVLESGGTAVQNGTVVRFSTTLGTVSPLEVQTRNGIATTTFSAGSSSGVAEVRATSGAASGGTNNTHVVQITIGAAAVNTVTLRANPGTVSPAGGSVQLVASVVSEQGRGLDGIPVTFNADGGTLSAGTVTTDSNGEARTTLTTSQQTIVSATAGAKTSSNVTITVRSGPGVTISCAPSSGTGNCSAVQAGSSNTASVIFTVAKTSSSSNLRSATIDFGDGTTQSLGTLAGSTTITKTYTGPSGSSPRSYTATVQATDINSETTSTATTVIITAKTERTPINVTISTSCTTTTGQAQNCTFTASATGGGEGGTGNASIQTYVWDFGEDDGEEVKTSGNITSHVYTAEGRYVVTVKAQTADGREATGRTELFVDF